MSKLVAALFVYGTLCFPEIVEKLTGKSFQSRQAVLKGFHRRRVKNADYPAIVKNDNSEVKGILFHDVDDLSFQIINFYEGDDYRIEELEVNVKDGFAKANVFIWNSDCNELENTDWNPNDFLKNNFKNYTEKVIPETILEFNKENN